jgi:hypothetical protein
VIAPSPRWRRPIYALIAVLAVTLGVLVGAFVAVTDDDPPPTRTQTQTITVQPGEALAPGVTPAPTTPAPTTPAPPTVVPTTVPTTTTPPTTTP